MKQKTLGIWQIVIGILAVVFYIFNLIATGMVTGFWGFQTNTSDLLFLGIFALLTGVYNAKSQGA